MSIYKGQVARHGSWQGVTLDTLNKAESYIRWQYQQGLITNSEMMDNLAAARAEFEEGGTMSEEVIAPIGRIIVDLGKLRATAYNDLLKLPATDPMKKILTDIDKLLGRTEEEIIKVASPVMRRRLWPKTLPIGHPFARR